jgi:hypothetical protein
LHLWRTCVVYLNIIKPPYSNAFKDFPYIERISLFDSYGVFWTATSLTPEISAAVGKDFSYRDYYQGVSKNWKPYVAEYKT